MEAPSPPTAAPARLRVLTTDPREHVERGRRRAPTALAQLIPPAPLWQDARRRLRAHRTAIASYLTNRRLAAQGRENLRPLYFIWTVSRHCNFLCTYCDDHRGRRYPELPRDGELSTAEGRALLSTMRTGTSSVYFAGGEPLLRDDLPELVRTARDLAYYPIVVNTNASALEARLRQPEWRRFLADVDVVVVSLDALDLDVLATMWGSPRPERVLEALGLLSELAGPMRFKLMVNTVIQPGTVEHAAAVLDLARDLSITFCPVPVNVGPTVHRGLVADEGYRRLARTILRRKRDGQPIAGSARMLRRLLFAEPLQCRNTLKPHVDHDGRLFWPCKGSVNVDPIAIDVLAFDDVDALWDHATRLRDPTGFHGAGPDQCGADCNWAQNYSTDTYAHGLTHPLSLVRDVVGFLS